MKASAIWALIWTFQFILGAEEDHVLHYFQIGSVGLDLPECMGRWSLDDRTILYYDSQLFLSNKDPPVPHWLEHDEGLSHWKEMVFLGKMVCTILKTTLKFVGEHGNLMEFSPHARIYQTHGYCKLHQNGSVSASVTHGYNGKDFFSFDIAARTWNTTIPQAAYFIENREYGAFDLDKIFHYYKYECIKRLRGIVNFAPWTSNKLVPKVHIFKQGDDLWCHVTGFYPKEVRVDWLGPDGLKLVEGVSKSEILPNEDGSYQLRRSLRLTEALQRSYSCVVRHASVAGNITLTWDLKQIGIRRMGFIAAVGCVLIALLFVLVVSRWRRREKSSDIM